MELFEKSSIKFGWWRLAPTYPTIDGVRVWVLWVVNFKGSCLFISFFMESVAKQSFLD